MNKKLLLTTIFSLAILAHGPKLHAIGDIDNFDDENPSLEGFPGEDLSFHADGNNNFAPEEDDFNEDEDFDSSENDFSSENNSPNNLSQKNVTAKHTIVPTVKKSVAVTSAPRALSAGQNESNADKRMHKAAGKHAEAIVLATSNEITTLIGLLGAASVEAHKILNSSQFLVQKSNAKIIEHGAQAIDEAAEHLAALQTGLIQMAEVNPDNLRTIHSYLKDLKAHPKFLELLGNIISGNMKKSAVKARALNFTNWAKGVNNRLTNMHIFLPDQLVKEAESVNDYRAIYDAEELEATGIPLSIKQQSEMSEDLLQQRAVLEDIEGQLNKKSQENKKMVSEYEKNLSSKYLSKFAKTAKAAKASKDRAEKSALIGALNKLQNDTVSDITAIKSALSTSTI